MGQLIGTHEDREGSTDRVDKLEVELLSDDFEGLRADDGDVF